MSLQSVAIGADIRKARYLRRQRAGFEAPTNTTLVVPSAPLQSEQWTVGRVCPDETVIAIPPKHLSFDGSIHDALSMPATDADDDGVKVFVVSAAHLDREVTNILGRAAEFQAALREETKLINDISTRQYIQQTLQDELAAEAIDDNPAAHDTNSSRAATTPTEDDSASVSTVSITVDTPAQLPLTSLPSPLLIPIDDTTMLPSTLLTLTEDERNIDGVISPEQQYLSTTSLISDENMAIHSLLCILFYLRIIILDNIFYFLIIITLPYLFSFSLISSSLYAIIDCITRYFIYNFIHDYIHRKNNNNKNNMLLNAIIMIHFGILLGCFSLAQAVHMINIEKLSLSSLSSGRSIISLEYNLASYALIVSILICSAFIAAGSTIIKKFNKYVWIQNIANHDNIILNILINRLNICKIIGQIIGPIFIAILTILFSIKLTIIIIGIISLSILILDIVTIIFLYATSSSSSTSTTTSSTLDEQQVISSVDNINDHKTNVVSASELSPRPTQLDKNEHDHTPSPTSTLNSPSYNNTNMNDHTSMTANINTTNTTHHQSSSSSSAFMYPTSPSMIISHRYILPAISYALLSVNVITFGASLCAFLEATGHSNMAIAIGRALTVCMIALSLTNNNTLVHSVGCDRIGLIAVWLNTAIVTSVFVLYNRSNTQQRVEMTM